MATKDPLLGLTVTINPDAKPAKGGGKHPYAGQQAQVIGKPPGGRSYWLQCGAAQVSVPLADFTVVGADAAQAAPADSSLPLSELVRSKTNRQIVEDEALLEMAATMKVYGVLQPLLVRRLPAERLQDTFEDEATKHATHEIIAGERRFMAARIAGLRRVPVHIVAADNSNAVVMQLIENLHRADLNPLDEAHGIQLLVDAHSMTRAAVADALRKSLSHVMESLRLLKICPEAIAALKAGTLNRSVALLVAQRPTPALQVEFTRKVLTGGPDGGPLSYRSAKDLAQRNYMTDLTQAPFALDNAQLLPQVGACTQCPKRTGANPELWDKAGADVCTDTACFADKKEAHYEALKADAQAKGRKIITGREARELMPTEGATPKGYILLDKPKKGSTEPMREVLGQEVPQGKVVLIETPTGGVVEAVPVRAAGEALQAKGAAGKADKKAPTRTKEELEDEYQQRWRSAAVRATIEGLRVDAEPDDLDSLSQQAAYRVVLTMARETHDEALAQIFQLSPGFSDDTLQSAVRGVAESPPRVQNMVLLMLAAAFDHGPMFNRPADEALHLEEVAPIAKVDIGAIKREVQQAMNAEAIERAAEADAEAAAPAADKAKPTIKPKGKAKGTVDGTGKASQAEVMAGIAQAMQQVEAPHSFTKGQVATLKTDVKNEHGKLIPCKGQKASILEVQGRKLRVSVPDSSWPFPLSLTVDYTDLEAADVEK
ncbi:ParB/RepB/Spo0J family partition protein [Acidovorax sp. ACV01]|uniref:ParB/RepB/Spo0J family partition protein n=1 Tax=Acidovorax sp. ACV01 TaxID=2769311 RepID=UPI00177EAF18|nr:ParB/RepB/Spo0J family partition protein [Acidovorax sp. ACV01]MBD9395577.1 ParB/RepB/Spo0J family partition protein [Acidovorax sp. ACV01]